MGALRRSIRRVSSSCPPLPLRAQPDVRGRRRCCSAPVWRCPRPYRPARTGFVVLMHLFVVPTRSRRWSPPWRQLRAVLILGCRWLIGRPKKSKVGATSAGGGTRTQRTRARCEVHVAASLVSSSPAPPGGLGGPRDLRPSAGLPPVLRHGDLPLTQLCCARWAARLAQRGQSTREPGTSRFSGAALLPSGRQSTRRRGSIPR
jgi:hypothetical protein